MIMITEVGKFLRKLRLKHGEILKNMADNLDVSSAFLSAVENGKKKMPENWTVKLENIYELNDSEIDELKDAILISNKKIEIDVENASDSSRQLALAFARHFDEIDDETSNLIIEILNKHGEN